MSGQKRRKGIVIMGQLIGLVRPLLPVMLLSILLGVTGFLCAIFLTILAGLRLTCGLAMIFPQAAQTVEGTSFINGMSAGAFFAILFLIAVLRGILHYGEQYCNHFIAFKLLAIIRHKVFANLRRLCPAKLEGKNKGDLISIITSDIELLEVFYAHTISPIAIASIVSVIMTVFLLRQRVSAGILALCAYIVVGVVIPLMIGRQGGEEGLRFRNAFGELNSFVLDSLRGIDETIQFGDGEKRMRQINERSVSLGSMKKRLNLLEASQRSVTNLVIQFFSFSMLFLMILQYRRGDAAFLQAVVCTIAMMGSFGPVVALSNLSSSLTQTLASGERVLSLLEEEPVIEEIRDGADVEFTGANVKDVDFAYEKEQILTGVNIKIPKGKVIGLHGVSGSGKSTILKLLMRFWDPQKGQIEISGADVSGINTGCLRETESYVTQTTYLFHDSIANNIAIGKLTASREEIMEAAKKASIHDFIMTLPHGYDTEVGELGDTLSGGERQRIGLARAFLHDAPLLLLDEPTSNLDSLNEGIILKSLKDALKHEKKTVVLVSHRRSTMHMADVLYEVDSGRIS